MTFLNEEGKTETWEYQGGTFTSVASWKKRDAVEIVQELGDGENSVVSQKTVTNLLNEGYLFEKILFVQGEINSSKGTNVPNDNRLRTDAFYGVFYKIKSSNNDIIAYLYDDNKSYLGFVAANKKQDSDTALYLYPSAKFVRFSIIGTEVDLFGYVSSVDNVRTIVNKIEKELQDISEIEGNISEIEGNISEIEGNISEIEGNISEIEGNPGGIPVFVSGEINSSSGMNVENSSRLRTDLFYKVDFKLTGGNIIVYAYDKHDNYLGFVAANTTQNSDSVKITYENAEKVRFSIIGTSSETIRGYSYEYIYSLYNLSRIGKESNILYGKKWAYCGDSFSAGGYSESEKTDDDIMPKDSKFAGKNKVYGYIIADRNNMTIQDFAVNGRTIATPLDGSFNNAFSNEYYKQIDSDVDYITMYFGINDSHHAPGGSAGDGEDNTGEIPIGNINDSDTSTFCGAYNVVIEYLIKNHPFAHIGIIVSNGCDTPEYAEKTIQIAKKWGIPYLDLNEAPVMIRSQSSVISSTTKNIVNLKQRISETNKHPNTKAHIYESTFIEHFLRSL